MKISSIAIGKKLEICFETGAIPTLIIVGICVILAYVYPESVYPICGIGFLFVGLLWGGWRYLPIKKNILRGLASLILSTIISFYLHLWALSNTNPIEYNRMMCLIYFSLLTGAGIVFVLTILDGKGTLDGVKKDIRRFLK